MSKFVKTRSDKKAAQPAAVKRVKRKSSGKKKASMRKPVKSRKKASKAKKIDFGSIQFLGTVDSGKPLPVLATTLSICTTAAGYCCC